MITAEQFAQIFPHNKDPQGWVDSMNDVFPKYGIDQPHRIAAFLAQCGHESAGWSVFEENLNYSAEGLCKIFGSHFHGIEDANNYARQPELIANRIYSNRMGNGDEASGDGYKFCGRGLIQLTGKDNYQGFADSLGISVEEASEYMETFEGCVQSACWFWETNNLNQWADAADMVTLTKKINGGTLGLEERQHFYHDIVKILS